MLEGFPACRIAFDSMAEVACEAAKVAYKEKIGDLQLFGHCIEANMADVLLEKIATSNF